MADNKESKPLMTGYMISTQLLEVDGCNRCQECMKWCPTFAVRPDRPGITPMYKNARWRELMAKNHSLRAKIFGGKPLEEDEMKLFTEDVYYCTTCGVCGTVCEAGIKTVDLWEAMRPNLVARGDGPYGKQASSPSWSKQTEIRIKASKKTACAGFPRMQRSMNPARSYISQAALRHTDSKPWVWPQSGS